MDPITHAIIGAGIYALSGGDISIIQPALLGCVAGSMVPDLDIIAKVRNDYYYLKYHRGSSHSFAGILLLSILTTAAIGLIFGSIDFFPVFAWTFAGAFLHVFFDIFNSYGAQILWPFSRKKYSLSLLGIFDMFILALAIAAVIFGKGSIDARLFAAAFGLYMLALGLMRSLARRRVSALFKGRVEPRSVKVLPASAGFFVWDFIIMSWRHSTVGRVNLLGKRMTISARLRRISDKEREEFMDNRAAHFFREFTPLFHVGVRRDNGFTRVVYTDLRYFFKNGFKHHAIAVFNSKGKLVECSFHPFCINRKIPL
jgi:inner membrane protein